MKTNCIYVHKVYSPYEGCFWRWNYVYSDKDGKLTHLLFNPTRTWDQDLNVTTSGQDTTHQRVERNCKKDFVEALEEIEKGNFGHKETQDVYDIDDIARFIKECNPNDVNTIATTLGELGVDIKVTCPNCNVESSFKDFVSTGSKGCGGLAIEFTDFICEDCYTSNICCECGEYSDKLNGEGFCEWCEEEQEEEAK